MSNPEIIADHLRQQFEDGLDREIEKIIKRERNDAMKKWEEKRTAQLEKKLTKQFENRLWGMVEAIMRAETEEEEKLQNDLIARGLWRPPQD